MDGTIGTDNSRPLRSARRANAVAEAAQDGIREARRVHLRFLAAMSQELRPPLNAIAGHAELLVAGDRGPLSEAQLADLRQILVNQRHLLRLVHAVIRYAGADAERDRFGPEDVRLGSVLSEVGRIVASQASEKGITFIGLEPRACFDVTVTEPEKLGQIMVNLMSNAIRFSPDGGWVGIVHELTSTHLEIRVTDSGPTIPPEYRERIFEPFARVDERLMQAHGGTGLGLAISRELALSMDGDLSVDAGPTAGSTFTLSVPRHRA